jgi:hypothetical protein
LEAARAKTVSGNVSNNERQTLNILPPTSNATVFLHPLLSSQKQMSLLVAKEPQLCWFDILIF